MLGNYITEKDKIILRKIAGTYKLNTKPLFLSDGQLEIFGIILLKPKSRVIIIAPTQYGKSLTVAVAVLTDILKTGDKWTILAPTEKKTRIIMSHIIDHIFDNPDYLSQLELLPSDDTNLQLERLRRERTRNVLTFKNGGGVMTLTLNADNGKKSIEAAMGFGSKKLVLDESSLIDDTLYATVKRMVGGYTGKQYEEDPIEDDGTFIFEIGNPFYRNHFYKTYYHNDRYQKIFIDYHDALREGRFSEDFIEEMRHEALFDIFYECKFPQEDEIDEKGYRSLIKEEWLQNAFVDELPNLAGFFPTLGMDIGGGSDKNTQVMKASNYMWIEGFNKSTDTMQNVADVQLIMQKYPNLKAYSINIDDIGIGRGVCDRCLELDLPVNPVTVGEQASDSKMFENIRAELYWELRNFLLQGGKILRDNRWSELLEIKYKITSGKRIKLEPKEEIRRRIGRSPDFADAGSLTFFENVGPISVKSSGLRKTIL